MTNTNVNATLDDIVFEHRNKDYGAYELRTSYSKTINRAFWIGTSVVMISISASAIYANLQPKIKEETGVIIDLKNFVQEEPEQPVEPPKPKEPEPIQEKHEIVKYLPPVPVEDAKPEDIVPPNDKLADVVIGSIDQEGTKSTSIIEAETPVEAPKPEAVITEIEKEEEPFITVEQAPTFAGGMSEMYKFLGKNIKYPSPAQRANVEGRVFLSFIVEKDGSITDVTTLKGIGFGCDEEAERVLKLMPKWVAGKQNGRAVRVKFTMPVIFKLSE
jgi:periplasmic protein TonB